MEWVQRILFVAQASMSILVCLYACFFPAPLLCRGTPLIQANRGDQGFPASADVDLEQLFREEAARPDVSRIE